MVEVEDRSGRGKIGREGVGKCSEGLISCVIFNDFVFGFFVF